MRKVCPSYRGKILKFEAEGREFAKFVTSLLELIQTVRGQNNFWEQKVFLTYSWRFLRSRKIAQI